MASLPPRSAPQQGERPQADQQPEEQTSTARTPSFEQNDSNTPPPPGSSTPSEPPLLNASSNDTSQPSTSPRQDQQQHHRQTPHRSPSPPQRRTIEDHKKCWICYADETEDTPLSSKWRSPCPCALTAHEACLLDWIADLQNTNARKRANASNEIRCPQCKSEIVVARPRSLFTDAITTIDRWAGRLVIPGFVTVFGGCLWSGCLMHGMNTIYLIFGPEDAASILGGNSSSGQRDMLSFVKHTWMINRLLAPFTAVSAGWNWQQAIGIPLIPVILVMSRTSLIDSIFPFLPILFFATQPKQRERLDFRHWPPSATLTLAVLPYLRQAYFEILGRLMGPPMRRWAKEMQPRGSEIVGEARPEAGRRPLAAVDDVEVVEEAGGVEVVVDIDIMGLVGGDHEHEDEDVWEDAPPDEDGGDENQGGNGNGNDNAPVPAQILPAPARGVGNQEQAAANAAAAPPEARPPAVGAPAHIQRVGRWATTTGHVADTIMGALFLPAISSAMGHLLSLILPRSWTHIPSRGRPTGLLQFQWGRSIVGGCLFVVLKDAAIIYARWRQMKTHRQRKVLDYDKKKKRVVR
ncbi:MAG: hypothetical protein M1823_003777 [Watsoniomyces obsoletus]|nr:MAG: hypothetical protein M1823_003777 [Watsoniomyces obsoletus]